jgi:hypothetical protein
MFWDITLPVLAAVAQVITGFLGWRVTVDGVRQERKRLYEVLFVIASLVGVVSVGIASYRGSQISSDLAALKLVQQQTQTGVQDIRSHPPVVNVAPPIVNIPPAPSRPRHAIVAWDYPTHPLQPQPGPFLPFSKDEQPRLNMGFSNVGDFALISTKEQGALLLVPYTNDQSEVYKKNIKAVLSIETYPSGTLVPHDQVHKYHTFIGPKLSDQDVIDLNLGAKMLCGIAVVTWSDTTGTYRTSFNECCVHEPDGGFNWHSGFETNHEEKLK